MRALLTRSRLATIAVALAFAVATVARGTDAFYYDASHYWRATQAVVGSLPAVPDGYWELRGLFTPFVYAPAAVATRIFGDEFAGRFVLLQNAAVFAVVAVLLLPAVVRIWRPVTTLGMAVGAVLFWVVISGFAPFPLMDAYAAIAVLGILVLIRSTSGWALLLGGLVAGLAINLRPALLIVAALLAVVILIWGRVRGLLFPAGIVAGLVPQVVVNLVSAGSWSPLPTGSGDLAALQAGYASYTVRYDTIFGATSARQFSCSPDMARLVEAHPPTSVGELVLTLLQTLPDSLLFSLEKVGASLAWHVGIPYSGPVRPLDIVYGGAIIALAIIGIVALVFVVARRSPSGVADRRQLAIIGAVILAMLLTLVSAATETRFSLTLVLLGVLGATALIGLPARETLRAGRWWLVVALAVTALFAVLAVIGLAHPAPRGDVTAAICAAA